MTKRAVLVGIDQYPDPRNNLNSCVADTLAFKNEVLQNTYGFDAVEIEILHNQDATLANVRTALDRLFANAKAGDELVFFESSHGYRYPKGNTMIEVLCLYDAFFEDTELVSRTQSLPPDVLTIALDACHSGGMSKMFFPPGGTAVARAKVYQPGPAEATVHAQLLQQVTQFKFFGREVTRDTGAVAKQFVQARAVPMPKDIGAGQSELNGALFAACMADQTAAAGSPATNNLSAFTFGVIKELDPTISLQALCGRVVATLEQLNMQQTPIVEVPIQHQELKNEPFIGMGGTQNGTQGVPAVPAGFDPDVWRRIFGAAA